ncbi:GTP 3',8-cyclase MoaA [Candidatus Latescibacterota bacterium]
MNTDDQKQKKPPVSLRISVTNRCQARCLYCTPEKYLRRNLKEVISLEEILRFVRALNRRYELEKVRITGGEPLLRDEVLDLISTLSNLGIEDIALTTNGQLLKEKARALKKAGLKRVNISLDSLNPVPFKRLTQGCTLTRTLAGIDTALNLGLTPVKINMVVMKDINDGEIEDLAHFGIEKGCQVRYLELMPIGITDEQFRSWFVPSDEIMKRLSETFSLTPLPVGISHSSRNFTIEDSHGRTGIVGFISPTTIPFCAGCRRLRLKADGKLVGCLARNNEYDIRSFLKDDRSVESQLFMETIETALHMKNGYGCFDNKTPMAEIGG